MLSENRKASYYYNTNKTFRGHKHAHIENNGIKLIKFNNIAIWKGWNLRNEHKSLNFFEYIFFILLGTYKSCMLL